MTSKQVEQDFLLAKKLQENYGSSEDNVIVIDDDEEMDTHKKRKAPENDIKLIEPETKRRLTVDTKGRSLVVPKERPSNTLDDFDLNDPNPDIHDLFLLFNDLYFQGRLSSVEVKWSKRMTSCAGLCAFHPGGYCSVRLSEPLLKLRSRQDLINTLLHEMIHAYIGLWGSHSKDHDAHGPDFLKMAAEINERAGSYVTIYHNFTDEVDSYKVHVWRCNGPCQEKPPYFGYVRRTMNRKPQKSDSWWQKHENSCTGTFEKIAGPPPKIKATSSKAGRKAK